MKSQVSLARRGYTDTFTIPQFVINTSLFPVDPNQMIWNAETKKKDGVNGRTAAKIRLLERYEWKVLVIDMQKWKLLGEGEGGKEAQKQFLFDTVTHKISV